MNAAMRVQREYYTNISYYADADRKNILQSGLFKLYARWIGLVVCAMFSFMQHIYYTALWKVEHKRRQTLCHISVSMSMSTQVEQIFTWKYLRYTLLQK